MFAFVSECENGMRKSEHNQATEKVHCKFTKQLDYGDTQKTGHLHVYVLFGGKSETGNGFVMKLFQKLGVRTNKRSRPWRHDARI